MRPHPSNELEQAAAGHSPVWNGVLLPLRRLQFLAMAVLILFWTTVVVIVSVTFALTAWGDRGGTQASQAPAAVTSAPTDETRPAGVPLSAQMVESDLVLGDVSDVVYFFRDASCSAQVLTIALSKAIVYAETSCASRFTPETVKRLAGQPVRVRLVARRLFIEALFVDSFQLDVGRVWVETR